ncbi:FecR domain-containing protein [bacterium]|nr:FecR domain-containing protein [Bacteroidales bacterium]MCK5685891.1 FecR domain-containing protein [bacterium]
MDNKFWKTSSKIIIPIVIFIISVLVFYSIFKVEVKQVSILKQTGGNNIKSNNLSEPDDLINLKIKKQKGIIFVLRKRSDIWNKASVPVETIFPGDSIKIEKKSKATLIFPSGTEIVLLENTMIEANNYSVLLKNGKAVFSVKYSGNQFKVITPVAIVGVLGTIFTVSHNIKNGTRVLVTKGKVKVTSKSETVFLVKNDFASINQIAGKISKNKKSKKNSLHCNYTKLTPEVESTILDMKKDNTNPVITETSETKEIVILSTSGLKIIGDIDGNGVINEIDSGLLQQYLISRNSFDENQKLLADVDKNGKLDRMDHMKLKIFCKKKYDLDQNGKIDQNDMILLKSGSIIDINQNGKIDKRDELTMKSILLQVIPNNIGDKL